MTPPPTILHLIDYTDVGGGEAALLAMLDEARRRAPALRHVAVVRGPGPLEDALAGLGVETRRVPYPVRFRRGLLPCWGRAAARELARLMACEAPRLVHAQHVFGLLHGGRAARRRGVPVLWTCHGPFDIDHPIKRWAARRYAAHIACVSADVERAVRRAVGPRVPTSVDPLGIRPAGLDAPPSHVRRDVRAEFGVPGDAPLIAVVGRFQPIKGHSVVLDALPSVWRRLPALRVWFIGAPMRDNPKEQREYERIVGRIRREGWGDRVALLGHRADARRLMRALDALVIPSFYESFGMVAIEGMDAGLPVVASRTGGLVELLDPPATGLWFTPGSADELAARVLNALLREGEGSRFDPEAGPRRVRERFSALAHWERTWALYRALASLDDAGAASGASSPSV